VEGGGKEFRKKKQTLRKSLKGLLEKKQRNKPEKKKKSNHGHKGYELTQKIQSPLKGLKGHDGLRGRGVQRKGRAHLH